jgi:hypothetical protein
MKAITNIAFLGLLVSAFGLGAAACVAPSGAEDEASSDNGGVSEARAEEARAEEGPAARSAQSLACGLRCVQGEGGSLQQSALASAGCPGTQASLTTSLTAQANAACRARTGFGACNIAISFSGCLYDGDVEYFIEYGYATYGCNDTTC